MSEPLQSISCDVCRDLAPLVQDQAASADSAALVHTHLQTCPDCRALFSDLVGEAGEGTPEQSVPDDGKVLRNIRTRINLRLLLLAGLGLFVGAGMSGMGVANGAFLSIAFPLVCGLTWWLDAELGRKMPFLAALLWFAYTLHTYWPYIGANGPTVITIRSLWATVDPFIRCWLGILASKLLKYASKGE